MGTTGALVFTGISTFSNDFQTILAREQKIEQIPVTALQNYQSDLLSKKQLLIGLNTVVGSLGSSIAALGSIAASQAVSPTSSDTGLVTVANNGATAPANYSITNISSLASAASGQSRVYADTTTTPVSTLGANTVQLVYGSTTKNITLTPATNNLAGLESAINNLGIGVTANILSTDSTHNYLTLSANATGQATLILQDIPGTPGNPDFGGTPTNLLASTNNGSNAMFNVNTVAVTRSTNTISDVISGVSLTIQGTTTGTHAGETVNISLATDPSQLSSAIQTFVTSYNALQNQLNAQIGPAAGFLSGDPLIANLSEDMWQLNSYQGPGSVKSLAAMGVTFDTHGQMAFNAGSTTAAGWVGFNSLTASQITDAMKFFGSPNSGFGKLASQFTQLSDPTLGLIRQQEDGYDRQNTNLTNEIDTLSARNAQRQAAFNARLQAADAVVAQLQSEQNLISASVQSLNYSLFGFQSNPGTPSSSHNTTG